MFCTNCGANSQGRFCQNCGAPTNHSDTNRGSEGQVTDVGLRIAAYLLDVIPAMIVGLAVGWIPIIGAILAGLILLTYWLLRDITGSSIGKRIVGLRVVRMDGSPSGAKGRILRNLPIAIGPGLLVIPLAGYALAPPVAGILILTEFVLLATKKQRLGDMLAGTTVVRKIAITNLAAV